MGEQDLEPLCCGSLVNQQDTLVCRLLGVLRLAGNINDPPTWCGAAWTIFVRWTWRPPSFMDKLLNGTRDQGDCDCVHGRDLIAGSNTLCECFNNMDVGVPLWLTEPWDKHPSQEFASSYPAL